MPGKSEPILFLREVWRKLAGEIQQLQKPVLAAVGLLLLSAGMTYMIVAGINEQMKPLPPLAKTVSPAQEQQVKDQNQLVAAEKQVSATVTQDKLPAKRLEAENASRTGTEQKPQQFEQPGVLGDVPVMAPFGWRQHPVHQDWRFHTGVDLAAAPGQQVTAIAGGRVSAVTTDRQLGLMVVVDTGDYTFYYASLDTAAVTVGTPVAAGDMIGTAGQSPDEPYPHTHLAIKKQGQFVDPQNIGK